VGIAHRIRSDNSKPFVEICHRLSASPAPMPDTSNFEALKDLRSYLALIRRCHVPTMNHYASADGKGFWHQPSKRHKSSLSSTATCVSSLIRAGLWKDEDRQWGAAAAIANRLLQKPWESAGLKANNPFSLSFIVEGVLDLVQAEPYPEADAHKKVINKNIVPILLREINNSHGPFSVQGSVSIKPYPASAYLTQLAFRVLRRCAIPDEEFSLLSRSLRNWARTEIQRQVTLISMRSRIADPMQLGYAIILAVSASAAEQTSPEEKSLVRGSLKLFFNTQQEDGTWPQVSHFFTTRTLVTRSALSTNCSHNF
jgi:hypothetical protein